MTIGARVSSQRFDAFMGNDGNHDQPCYRIGPPPAKESVENKPPEQDGGEVGAQVGLSGIRFQRAALQARGDSALGTGQKRHDDQ